MKSELAKYLKGIEDYTGEGKKEEFLRKIRSIPNVEEKFENALKENQKWKALAKSRKTGFVLNYKTKGEAELKLLIFDNITDTPKPVISISISK